MANWVSAGCGVIANELAQAMEKRGQKLYGVVNRTPEKAVAFAEKYGVQKVFTSFQDVCADPAVDIIYISTPHNTHRTLTMRGIQRCALQPASMCCAKNPLR